MKRVIVDYAKLTNEILTLLVERFPDGYDDSNIIRFRNTKNELIEAVEVGTEDTIYLVKVSTKLADRIENYDEEDEIDNDTDMDPIEPVKDPDIEIDIDEIDEDANVDDEEDDDFDKPDMDNGDDDDDDDNDKNDSSDDDDDDDED